MHGNEPSVSAESADPAAKLPRIDVHFVDTALVTLLSTANSWLTRVGVPLHAVGGGLVVSGEPGWLPAPPVAALPGAQRASSGQAAKSAVLASQLPGFFQAFASFEGIASLQVQQGRAAHGSTVSADWTIPRQVGTGTPPRLATTYDMSVIDQQSGRWYVKDIRASTLPMGTQ